MAVKSTTSKHPQLDLKQLNVKDTDEVSVKLLMLIEGTYGIGVKESIAKYGYTEQRYYQLLKAFKEKGSEALVSQKSGPKQNSKRTDVVIKQVLRLRYLDPHASASVISQKLKQIGHKISTRSVERTIEEYGLQKKTL